MTKSEDSPVTRETRCIEKTRPLLVTLKGSTMELRFKGTRKTYYLDYEVALAVCYKQEAREKGIKI